MMYKLLAVALGAFAVMHAYSGDWARAAIPAALAIGLVTLGAQK